jgi:hypothetical protein
VRSATTDAAAAPQPRARRCFVIFQSSRKPSHYLDYCRRRRRCRWWCCGPSAHSPAHFVCARAVVSFCAGKMLLSRTAKSINWLIFVARGAETQPFGETKASLLYMGVFRWLTILGTSLLKRKIRGRRGGRGFLDCVLKGLENAPKPIYCVDWLFVFEIMQFKWNGRISSGKVVYKLLIVSFNLLS